MILIAYIRVEPGDPHARIEADIRRLDAERRAAYVEHEQTWIPCSCWPNHQEFCEHCSNRGGWWEAKEKNDAND